MISSMGMSTLITVGQKWTLKVLNSRQHLVPHCWMLFARMISNHAGH